MDLLVTIALTAFFTIIFVWVWHQFKTKKVTAEEAALSAEVPDECPKCGHHKDRPNSMRMNVPTYHSPIYHNRIVFLGIPEHLSHRCWECGHEVRTSIQKAS